MTNKEQIMIDGVNVGGCEHALQGKHTILCAGSEDRALCDANKNCLYKKYKRKEQECKKWKNAYEVKEDALAESEEYCEELEEKLKAKEQECEEKDKSIKFLLEKLNLSNNRIQDCEIHWEKEKKNLQQQLDQLKKTNEELQKENKELKKCYKNNSALLDFEETNTTKLVNKVMKLEKTLTEIKGIAEENIRIADLEGLNGVYRRGLAKQILQKISECEVNND